MQTRKRVSGRNSCQEHASPRISRAQKKTSENGHGAEKRVTELITSSARKQRFATNLNKRYGSEHDENPNACLEHNMATVASMDHKVCNEGSAHELETIFSPAFHISKISGGDIAGGVDFIKFFWSEDQKLHQGSGVEYSQVDMLKCHNTQESSFVDEKNCCNNSLTSFIATGGSDMEDANVSSRNLDAPSFGQESIALDTNMDSYCGSESGPALSSEVSAIYLAMKNSKLECIDEHGQVSMSADVCVEDEDSEEFDDFDPYLFIKNLPDLSAVVPTFRPVLLPKQTRSCPPTTLVLDLDETLVHSSLEPCDDVDFTFPVNFNLEEHTVYVRCRPHLRDFMERVSRLFEIIIFTASQSIYAEQLLNVLDPRRKFFRHRVFRESCVFVDGNYLKDLSVLGRDLSRVIIIDNSPQAFGFQVDNGIPIESWFDDRTDEELLVLLPFLESLVGVKDVRPLIAKKFNLREKIEAAVYPPLISNRGDPFER